MTVLRSAPPARSHDAFACLKSCIRIVRGKPATCSAGRHTRVRQAAELVGHVAQFLCQDDGELCGCAIEVLRAVPPSQWCVTSLDVVAVHCRGWLEKRVSRPLRSPGDWSVTLPRGCSCQLCGTLSGFLSDPARRVFEWPLAKDRRSHIHSRIDSAELPIIHQTRRKGSPYTLVLTKTSALFEQEERARERHQADLALVSGRNASRSPRR